MHFKRLIPLLVVTGCISACTSYATKPGKIENLIGTYELVTYKMRHEEVTEGDNTYDKQAEIGAVAYFSVGRDGYGYYGYKDNSTSPRVDSVFVSFFYNEEKPNLVEAIDVTDGVTHKYDDQKCPGCLDEPKMGFKSELFKKSLNYTVNYGHMLFQKDRIIPYRYVEYKRVSKEASLAKVNQYMGTNVSFDRPYEMKAMTGYALYRCTPKNGEVGVRGIYEYAILDLDSYANGEITLTYSLKENPGRQTKQLAISVEEAGKSMKIEGLDKTFYSESADGTKLSIGNFSTRYNEYAEEDMYYGENFTVYYGSEVTIDYIIEQETAQL